MEDDIRRLANYDIEVSHTVDIIDGMCIDRFRQEVHFDRDEADRYIKELIDKLYEELGNDS